MTLNTLQRFVTMLQCYKHFSTSIQTQTLFVITQNRCNIVTTVLLSLIIIKKRGIGLETTLKTMLQNCYKMCYKMCYTGFCNTNY